MIPKHETMVRLQIVLDEIIELQEGIHPPKEAEGGVITAQEFADRWIAAGTLLEAKFQIQRALITMRNHK